MTRISYLTAPLLAAALLVGAAAPSRPAPPRVPAHATPHAPPVAPSATPAPPQAAGPATAPTRDGVVAYHLAPAGGAPFDVVVLFRAGGAGLRVDLPDKSYMLATPAAQTLVLVVPIARTAMTLPWQEGPQPLFLVDARMKFTRRTPSTVAGQRCTQWEAVREQGHNMLCVSDDGLVLRNQFQDAQGRRSTVEALAVRFDAMLETDFTVPVDFERLDAGPQQAAAPAPATIP